MNEIEELAERLSVQFATMLEALPEEHRGYAARIVVCVGLNTLASIAGHAVVFSYLDTLRDAAQEQATKETNGGLH